MISKTNAKAKIAELIEKYEKLKSAGKLEHYNEANTRKDFIMPLFEALGWDVRNSDEVSEEETVSNGSVDYAFKLGSITKFYLETKKFSVDLEEERWAEQAINYAWYKSVAWAALSDFEGIKIFNAEWKEHHVSRNRYLEFNYDEYLKRFDELWLLSKESIEQNLLDKEAEKVGKKEKRKPVNEAIFADLIDWRRELLDSIDKTRQEIELSDDEKEEVVQKLLDRLIFIRSCEDRGFEDRLLESALRTWESGDEKEPLYDRVVEIFKHYSRYDSPLFCAGHPCEKINIYNGTVRKILKGLYFNYAEKIRYDFKNIPADILGGIYEQYLGYILKKGKLVKGMPHRKEKGIYYTPKHIVDYIVENTLGQLLNEIPREKAGQIKILDPACGSGSFLIKALEVMDEYYAKDPHFEKVPFMRRIKVLTNNLYGVDLDEKAVEIAQLNLMLRALTGRRELPDISSNIKCGNSLISGLPEELKKYFGPDWRDKKPFNWEEEFPHVLKQGGFDVIIGNPPYVQLSMESSTDANLKRFLIEKYSSSMGRLNTFGFFIKLGIDLLKEGGLLGFIIPNTILTQDYYDILRRAILENCSILGIVSFEDLPFKDAIIENVILILKKTSLEKERKSTNVVIYRVNSLLQICKSHAILQKLFYETRKNTFIIGAPKEKIGLKQKIEVGTAPLGNLLHINQAIALKHERLKYIFDEKHGDNYKPLLDGRNINRYIVNWRNKFLLYDISAIHSCKREDIFLSKEKIFFRRVSDRLVAAYDDRQFYALNTLVVMNKKDGIFYDLKFILGLFNSKLLNYYYCSFLKSTKKVFSEIQARQVYQLPIKMLDLSLEKDKKKHSLIKTMVQNIIDLNKQLQIIPENTNKWHKLKEEIERLDRKIDEEVYKLYGLTEGEVKAVEEA